MPPAAIQDTSAESILAGIEARLPISLADLKSKADNFTLLLNSDSAASCLKLGKAFVEHPDMLIGPGLAVNVLHPGCLMHQTAIVASTPLKWMRIVNNLFAASCFFSKAANLARAKAAVKPAKVAKNQI